jgi:hypothetical protein
VLRSDGVLKRVAATPLPPAAYLTSQLASTFITTALIAVATVALGGLAFGTVPRRLACSRCCSASASAPSASPRSRCRAGYAPGPQRFLASGIAVLAARAMLGIVLVRRFSRCQP